MLKEPNTGNRLSWIRRGQVGRHESQFDQLVEERWVPCNQDAVLVVEVVRRLPDHPMVEQGLLTMGEGKVRRWRSW